MALGINNCDFDGVFDRFAISACHLHGKHFAKQCHELRGVFNRLFGQVLHQIAAPCILRSLENSVLE